MVPTEGNEMLKSCREKNWDELNADEKIERMRGEVKLLKNLVNDFAAKVAALENHDHKDGVIVLPYRKGTYGLVSDGESIRGRRTDWF